MVTRNMGPRNPKTTEGTTSYLLEMYRYANGFSTCEQLHQYFEQLGFKISGSSIYKIEAGKRPPTEDHLAAYITALELDEKAERLLLTTYFLEQNEEFYQNYEEFKQEYQQRIQEYNKCEQDGLKQLQRAI